MSQQMQDVSFNSLKRKWRSEPFVWGKSDCILSVCDYVRDITGKDPAAPWRGTYDSEEGAHAIINEYGGVLGLCEYSMAKAGFDRCDPKEGAPAILDVLGTPLAGILGAKRAIMRHDKRGILEMPFPVLGAWNIWQ